MNITPQDGEKILATKIKLCLEKINKKENSMKIFKTNEELLSEAILKKSRLEKHKENEILSGKLQGYLIQYVIECIGERSEILERTILSQNLAEFIYKYANFVIEGRWIEAEKKMLDTEVSHWHLYYAQKCIKNRWPELEKNIIDNIERVTRGFRVGSINSFSPGVQSFGDKIENGIEYAEKVLKNRWPEFEKKLLEIPGVNSNRFLIKYGISIVKSEWPEFEKKIIKENDANYAFEYCKYVIKDRNKNLEEIICSNYTNKQNYKIFIKTKIEKCLKNKNYDEIIKYCDYKEYPSIIKNLYKKYFIPNTLKNSILAQSLVGDKESLKTLQEDKLFKTKVKCLIEELLNNNSITENSTTKDILRVL